MIDEQNFYEEIIETCNTQGWKNILELIQADKEMVTNILNLKTPEDLWKAKGKLEAYIHLGQMMDFANGVLDDLEDTRGHIDRH